MTRKVKADSWNRALVIANCALVLVTAIYTIYTYCILHQTISQTEILRKSNNAALCPYIRETFDTSRIYSTKYNNKMIVDLSGYDNIRNDGNTPAELFIGVYKIYRLNRDSFNILDSLIHGKNTVISVTNDYKYSKFIPAHSNFIIKRIFADIQRPLISNSGNTFLHIVLIYKDVFNEYHSVYCLHQFELNQTEGLVQYNPLYEYHDFSDNERKILDKIYLSVK